MIAVAHSAVTVVNALASWKGAALGINLKVKAKAEIKEEDIDVKIKVRGKDYHDLSLVKEVVKVIRERTGMNFGVKINIDSEIPVAKGLKSSSAVANAVTVAILKALDIHLGDEEILKIGVEAAKRARVTLTGAYDDACASYFGGLVFTDNRKMSLLKRERISSLPVVLLVPSHKVETYSLRHIDFSVIKDSVERIFHMAFRGEWRYASFLNALAYASLLGYDIEPILEAYSLGATVGLCGKGPALFAITEEPEMIQNVWNGMGEIIKTEVFG